METVLKELNKCLEQFREWQKDSRACPETPTWMAYRECADKLATTIEHIKDECLVIEGKFVKLK